MEIRFDATIDNEDITYINWVRFYINAALSRIPDAPEKNSKGSIVIAIQSKAIEYQDKIREALDRLLFKDRQLKSKESNNGDYRWGHLTKKRYPKIELDPFISESDSDCSLKMITAVVFPQKSELEHAEEIVEGLRNLKRLADTTIVAASGTFEASCPVCADFRRFPDPYSAKKHLQSRAHKGKSGKYYLFLIKTLFINLLIFFFQTNLQNFVPKLAINLLSKTEFYNKFFMLF